jgi:hypothetical protein
MPNAPHELVASVTANAAGAANKHLRRTRFSLDGKRENTMRTSSEESASKLSVAGFRPAIEMVAFSQTRPIWIRDWLNAQA